MAVNVHLLLAANTLVMPAPPEIPVNVSS
jgi:hypothetical protein